jgi:WD40 repeat protein
VARFMTWMRSNSGRSCCSRLGVSIRFWAIAGFFASVSPGQSTIELRPHIGQPLPNGVLAMSPNGRIALTGGQANEVVLWDVATGKELRRFVGHSAPTKFAAFSSDSLTIVTGAAADSVMVWEAATGRLLRSFGEPSKPLFAERALFSPDGHSLIISTFQNVLVFSLRDGTLLRTWQAHTQTVAAIAIADGTDLLITGGRDNHLRLWDWRTGSWIRDLPNTRAWPTHISFSKDSTNILVEQFDRSVSLVNIDTG